jgi:murein DD-endopeptidase MepM/ murein hydrolase activator NlpD
LTARRVPRGAGRVAWGAGLAAVVVSLGVGVGWAVRDATPPELWLEAPTRVAAGEPFEVYVSASKPVTFVLRYGDERIERVAEELRTTLVALAGRAVLQIDAVDGAGTGALVAREIDGRRRPEPRLEAPPVLEAGDPLVAWVRLDPRAPAGSLAEVRSLTLTLDDEPLPMLARPEGWVALRGVALDAAPGTWMLTLRLEDEFGPLEPVARPIEVRSNPRPVDELNVPAGTLALVTPAARDEEAAVMAAALAHARPEPRWAEPFLLPVEGRDTSGFGDPRRYAPGGNVSYHLGADIAAPTGTPILATNDGIVRVAGFYPIKGGWVVLDHGQRLTSHHFHLAQIDVAVGDVVVRGDVIGQVGSTGLSTGPHLHWEMRIDGVPTDPMAWIGQRYPWVARP